MKSYIFIISENVVPFTQEHIYVKTTENAIRERMYRGGFLRFLSSCYDDAKKYNKKTKIEGQDILSLKQFDEWLAKHYCL